MARLFDDGNNDYLVYAGAPVSAAPFTMACLINVDDDTNFGIAMSLCDADGDDWWRFEVRGDQANDLVNFLATDDPTNGLAVTSAGITANTPHHICAVEAASNSRSVYLDGGNKGTNNTEVTPDNISHFFIGVFERAAGKAGYFSGLISEVAIWNVALTDAEVASLGNPNMPLSPLLVRPQSLVAYWDLIRGLNDRVGGYNLTATGTTISNHPRILMPYSQSIFYPSAGFPNISKSISATLEMEAAMTKKTTYPISSTLEMEAVMTRDMKFPLSTTLEMEVALTRHLKLPLSTTVELESTVGKGYTMPLSALLEMESIVVRNLTFPLSAILEMEAAITLEQLGLKKSISVTLEMEALMTRGLTFPISAVLNMSAEVVMAITGLDNPVLYYNAKNRLFYLTSEDKKYRYVGKNKNFRITYNEGD